MVWARTSHHPRTTPFHSIGPVADVSKDREHSRQPYMYIWIYLYLYLISKPNIQLALIKISLDWQACVRIVLMGSD